MELVETQIQTQIQTQFIEKLPCYGGIIFDPTLQNVLIVKKLHCGTLGFPKGKRNKGETPLETALREVNEETSLKLSDITLVPSPVPLCEVSSRAKPDALELSKRSCFHRKTCPGEPNPAKSIGYFIGLSDMSVKIEVLDKDEGIEVFWMSIAQAGLAEKLPARRKSVLRIALDIASRSNNQQSFV